MCLHSTKLKSIVRCILFLFAWQFARWISSVGKKLSDDCLSEPLSAGAELKDTQRKIRNAKTPQTLPHARFTRATWRGIKSRSYSTKCFAECARWMGAVSMFNLTIVLYLLVAEVIIDGYKSSSTIILFQALISFYFFFFFFYSSLSLSLPCSSAGNQSWFANWTH